MIGIHFFYKKQNIETSLVYGYNYDNHIAYKCNFEYVFKKWHIFDFHLEIKKDV